MRLRICAYLLGVLLLAACLGTSEEAPSPEEGISTVEAKNIKFQPGELTVKQGSSVAWVNRDPFAHTVTFSDGSFDGRLEKGGSIKRSFSEPGSYEYVCTIHPSMKGVIIVEKTSGMEQY